MGGVSASDVPISDGGALVPVDNLDAAADIWKSQLLCHLPKSDSIKFAEIMH
jgi:hypothetical protein